jgi:subtilisin-like proprotein convertase family protein
MEHLEERALLSTVFRAVDVPQRVDFLDVFTTSSIDVPQNLTIASLKVQLNISYPLDNDLTIDLVAPNGTDVPLSSFEGSGANFQGTVFDDAAATPIWAGNSPFAGSYRTEAPLSAVAGMNAQGTWQLQIVDWGASSGTLNSWSLIVQTTATPPTASSLVVGGFPTSTTAGQAGSFTVTAEDATGNVATGYTGTVHFTSSDPQAGLPADYTFTAADAGRHTFHTALKTAGNQSLTVSDTAASGLTGTEANIAVSPAAANHLAFGQQPTNAAIGATISPAVTVRVLDAYNNLLTGDITDSVTLTLGTNPGGAALRGTTTVTVYGGIATFGNLSLTQPGSGYTLVARSGSLTAARSAGFAVSSSGALVFHSADTPVALNPSNLYVESAIIVPQSVTIASLKVQVNITYPLDSDLRINLIYIDSGGFQRAYVTLSDFVGAGANFQDTIFDDTAATPIAAGTPPFAGSYRPSDPLSTFVGLNAQGTWALDVGDFVGGSGTINSWSLIIQPAGSSTAAPPGGMPLPVTLPSPSPAPIDVLPLTGQPTATSVDPTAVVVPVAFPLSSLISLPARVAGNTALAGPVAALPAGPAATPAGAEPVVVRPGAGLDTLSTRHVRDGRRGDPAGVLVNGVSDDAAL